MLRVSLSRVSINLRHKHIFIHVSNTARFRTTNLVVRGLVRAFIVTASPRRTTLAWREVVLVAKRMRQRPTHLPIRGHVVRARPVLSLSDAGQPSAYLTACLYERLNGPNVDEHAAWGKNNWDDRRAGPHGKSDKCASHAYHHAYERYLLPLRDAFVQGLTAKVLEVGLGCGQKNVGAGVRMWDQLFANDAGRQLELHVMVRPVALIVRALPTWNAHAG